MMDKDELKLLFKGGIFRRKILLTYNLPTELTHIVNHYYPMGGGIAIINNGNGYTAFEIQYEGNEWWAGLTRRVRLADLLAEIAKEIENRQVSLREDETK